LNHEYNHFNNDDDAKFYGLDKSNKFIFETYNKTRSKSLM